MGESVAAGVCAVVGVRVEAELSVWLGSVVAAAEGVVPAGVEAEAESWVVARVVQAVTIHDVSSVAWP